ncbi:DNA recombination protein RmuC [Microbacterium sp. gxy059]|uniref:DNA recombination protein RmuC n=1 Tax=Microbacterium sp. gxy059 TaxID=2957199 RepID=UPI003D974A7A
MNTTALIVILLVALAAVAGASVAGFLLGRQRASADHVGGEAELAAARLQISALQQDVESQRAEVARRVEEERAIGDRRVQEAREAGERALDEARDDAQRRREEQAAAADARLADERARAERALVDERQRAAQRVDELRADQKRLADEFEALSRKALEANSQQFLRQAEERLARSQSEGAAELRKREEAVQRLVQPLRETLDSVKTEVSTAEKARAEASAALRQELETMQRSSKELGEETRRLVNALRAPQVRGRWGELQLRRVVEAAGMVNHVDFGEQEHHVTDDGALRPDLVVHLAGGKHVVVDAKVAFSGYLEAMEAADDLVRGQRLQAHARHMRKHIDDLGEKEYWDAVSGSPEFVVMFVPAEPFLAAALDQDPTLYEHAFARNVVIATPSTLVALLRTVGHAWRQDQLAQEAQQIFEVGKELHKRLGVLGKHLATLGKRLNSAVEAYNAFAGSLDRNVVTQARRFSALQGLDDVLDDTTHIETLATPPQKPDLYELEEGAMAADAE